MASIFSGVPQIWQPSETSKHSDYTANFAQGAQLRNQSRQLDQADERIRMEQADNMRQDLLRGLQMESTRLNIEESQAKLTSMMLARKLEVDARTLEPQGLSIVGQIKDWTDSDQTKPWDEFTSKNTAIIGSPVYQMAEKRRSSAFDHKWNLVEIDERNSGLLNVAEQRGSRGGGTFSKDLYFQRLKEARAMGDEEGVRVYSKALGIDPTQAPVFIQKWNAYEQAKANPSSSPEELAFLQGELNIGPTQSDRSKMQDSIANLDKSIATFDALASGGKINNATVGPLSYVVGGFDFAAGLLGQSIYDIVGAKGREQTKTKIRNAVSASTRALIDEPGGMLSTSDRVLAREIISADDFLTTPEKAKTQLSTLSDIFRVAKESAVGRISKSISNPLGIPSNDRLGQIRNEIVTLKNQGVSSDDPRVQALARQYDALKSGGQ